MFALALVLAAATALPPAAPCASLDERITAVAKQSIEAEGAAGAVAVVCDGSIAYIKGFGVRNLSRDEFADADTQFEIGSISKQFTAAAILQLKEQGKLALDDPLASFLPSFPHAREITLRQLLNQTSGLPNYTDDRRFIAAAEQQSAFSGVERFIAGKALHFKPGTNWEYSNSNYAALGRVVETVSGESYAQYLREHIFALAGMTHSVTMADEQELRDFAIPYWRGIRNDGPLMPSPPMYHTWADGAGSIVSTAGDLALWDLALQRGAIVNREDLALMTTPGKLANGESTFYGFGWMIDSVDDEKRVWHSGGTYGSSASNVTFPDRAVDVIVLENAEFAPTGALTTRVFETMFPEVAAAARTPGDGEDPAVTARAKRIIAAAINGSLPARELSPLVRSKIPRSDQQAFGKQLAALGVVKDVIFKKKTGQGGDTVYVYRVDFANVTLNLIMAVNNRTNLIDGLVFPPT